MKQPKDGLLFKASLLSISLFLMMAPQISAALPLLIAAFPDVPAASVETLATVPNFGIVLGLFLSPFVIRWLGTKATVLTGLALLLVTGTFPMYSTDFTLILVSRFLLGVSIGLFNSLAVSLVSDFYGNDENERATMLGYQNVMGSVGAALSSFLVSYLLTISWQAVFAIYLLAIPAFLLFAFFVPLKKTSQTQEAAEKQHLNGKVFVIAGLMFFIFLLYLPVAFKLPTLVTSENLGDASQVALLSGISTLVGIPLGASFGFFFKRLHDKIFPIGFAIVTLGFAFLVLAPNIWLILAAILVIGFGFGLGVPYMYNWLSWAAPPGSMNLATTVVLVLVNIGSFLSPMVMSAISGIFGQSARITMAISGVGFALITLYAILHYLRVHKKN